MKYELKIDNKKQTIQGVHIKDRETFFNIRAVVEAECLEGWKPTTADIQMLLNTANDKDAIAEIEKEWNDLND